MIQVLKNINQLLTLSSAMEKNGRNLLPDDLSIITDATLIFDNESIIWSGKTNQLPLQFAHLPFVDLKGFVVTPELVDSHTHLLFSGDRSEEYLKRLNGVSYQEIAALGGGIKFTSLQTNLTTDEALFKVCVERIKKLYSHGIGSIEIKSGYGLNYQDELRYSKLIFQLKKYFEPQVNIVNTYMAAHAIPEESTSSQYMKNVVIPLLHELAPLKIIDFVDIFHEENYFNSEDVYVLFNEAVKLGIPRKIHADEFKNNDGAQLAVDLQATSADHLLAISDENIDLLANSNCIATILPGTSMFLGKNFAPARKMLDRGIKLAIASDYNPGSCHFNNLLFIASLCAPTLKMNTTEVFASITLNAAHALGLQNQGAIVPGLKPRFSFFKTNCYSNILYNWGENYAITSNTFLSY